MERRRRAASVPAHRHTRFGIAFERSANPMLLADDMRRIADANPAACRFLGRSRTRLCNLEVDDLIAPHALRPFEGIWIRMLSSEGARGNMSLLQGGDRRVEAHVSWTADIERGLHLGVFSAAKVRSAGIDMPKDQSAFAKRPPTRILTPRHVEVLTQLATGQSVEEIVAALEIAPETVRVHIRNARRRLGARSRPHAVALAVQRGAITP